VNTPDFCLQGTKGDRAFTGTRYRHSARRSLNLLHEPLTPEQQEAIARAKTRFCPWNVCGAPGPNHPVQVDAESWEARCAEHLDASQ